MSEKAVQLILMTLLLAALTLQPAAAQSEVEEVRIYPWMDGVTYVINPGQIGVIRHGWAACNRGLVQVYIKASNFDLTLVDADETPHLTLTPGQVDELWGPIEPWETCPYPCRGRQGPARAYWQSVLPDLAPGEYELRSTIWVDHPVTDGGDWDGDGVPDVLRPEDLYFDTVNTIIISDE